MSLEFVVALVIDRNKSSLGNMTLRLQLAAKKGGNRLAMQVCAPHVYSSFFFIFRFVFPWYVCASRKVSDEDGQAKLLAFIAVLQVMAGVMALEVVVWNHCPYMDAKNDLRGDPYEDPSPDLWMMMHHACLAILAVKTRRQEGMGMWEEVANSEGDNFLHIFLITRVVWLLVVLVVG